VLVSASAILSVIALGCSAFKLLDCGGTMRVVISAVVAFRLSVQNIFLSVLEIKHEPRQ
jgi:hypothetical protein